MQPASISLTEVIHGCVRSEAGWATIHIDDQNNSLSLPSERDATLGSMLGCGMHGRPKPNFAEKC